MTERPILRTERLLLRPFTVDDAPEVERYASAREIAANTLLIPHPYPPGEAERWISGHQEAFDEERTVVFAITLLDGGELTGAIALMLTPKDDRGEIGYWIGLQHWGRGYASEAAAAVLRYGFEVHQLNRIEALHFASNPASGHVIRKLGMRHEGTLRQLHKKWDQYVDAELYAMLRSEWLG
jgi:ribosomal-protein-alanine N-acetyltransferase